MICNIGPEKMVTQRLIIRPYVKKDAVAIFRNWASDPLFQVPLNEPVYNHLEEVEDLVQKYIHAFETTGKYRWALATKDTDECIGLISYFLIDDKNDFAEMEYGIAREYWGQGLTLEAVEAVVQFGFEKMKLHKVQITCKEYNKASRRVIEKCGMVYEGTLRDYFNEEGKYIGRMYYSLLAQEYFDAREKD
ncbi:MAG: N-acetyltransferase [Clostridia bacterium]|nr:N-acetyltransferase [Clostridia bacterium]